MLNILDSRGNDNLIRPSIKDVWSYYTHPFPTRDGNRRSFVQAVDPNRMPQNGVAPFRMEYQAQVQVDWSKLNTKSIVTFVGE